MEYRDLPICQKMVNEWNKMFQPLTCGIDSTHYLQVLNGKVKCMDCDYTEPDLPDMVKHYYYITLVREGKIGAGNSGV